MLVKCKISVYFYKDTTFFFYLELSPYDLKCHRYHLFSRGNPRIKIINYKTIGALDIIYRF